MFPSSQSCCHFLTESRAADTSDGKSSTTIPQRKPGKTFHQKHELTPSYREGSASRTQGLLTRVGRQASTGEVSVVAHFEVRVDRIVVGQLDHLLESVVDEDEAD